MAMAMGMTKGRRLAVAWAVALALLTARAPAQEGAGADERIAARVTAAAAGGGIVIDRGAVDGLQVGDRVEFQERGGGARFGVVVETEARVATVRPEDPDFRPVPGVRATISVPAARFADDPPGDVTPPPVPVPVPADPGPTGDDATGKATGPPGMPPSTWTRDDDEWTMDMPLLAEVRAVPPRQRPLRWRGRSYLSWDGIIDTEDGRGDSFLRAGGAALVENPFGRGGVLHVDAEWNARRAGLIDENDESDRTFRLDRLSYTSGGHRHDPSQWRVGRFLQDDIPEFGILDGASWKWRSGGGDTWGVSAGFLPEPDKDQESFQDLQVAAWYRWVADEREILTVTTGYQKTWHNGSRDRDLIVSRLQYVPAEGWNVFGSLWVDLYGPGDDIKASGPRPTYAILDAQRALGENSGISFEYRHQEYPELQRRDFPFVGPEQVDDAHVDRLSATYWSWIVPRGNGGGIRGYTRLGSWADEEDAGGDGEAGLQFHGVFGPGGRFDIAGFGASGKFSSHIGGRVRYGHVGPRHSWSLQYELRTNDITGFDANNDDLAQHRIRATYDLLRASGTSVSVYAEGQFQDREDQAFLGLFLQRNF